MTLQQNLTQDEILTFLTKELTIQKNATSLSLYKLKSREEPRPTSAIVGVIGSVLIGGMFGLLLLSDAPILVRHLRAAVTAQPLDQTNQRRRNAMVRHLRAAVTAQPLDQTNERRWNAMENKRGLNSVV